MTDRILAGAQRILATTVPPLTPPAAPGVGTTGTPGVDFAATFRQAVNDISGAQDVASDAVQAYLRGEQIELHQVMAATEEAGIALETLLEVRNKFLDAYRSVMSMQV